MRPIDPELVEEVWRDVTSYPADRVEAEASAFLARQPHVSAFARAMVRAQDEAVQKAAFGLTFLLFKILERSLGRPFPLVSERRIVDAYETTRARLVESGEPSAAGVLAASPGPAHPTLVAHLLSVFYADDQGPAEYDETVRASLQLLLTTLAAALDLGAIEPD